jgi:TonB family protein
MSRLGLFVFVALASVVIAQSLPKPTVVVSRLSPPIYPKLALQARIATTVVLDVTVRPDGSVDSVALFSGHPMLNDAAKESAKKTAFECKDCREPSTSYRMTYQFELGDPLYCKGIDANGYGIYDVSPDTEVSQSQGVITVRGRPYTTCDPAERISFAKFRSAKCLYLWRCGKRPLQ